MQPGGAKPSLFLPPCIGGMRGKFYAPPIACRPFSYTDGFLPSYPNCVVHRTAETTSTTRSCHVPPPEVLPTLSTPTLSAMCLVGTRPLPSLPKMRLTKIDHHDPLLTAPATPWRVSSKAANNIIMVVPTTQKHPQPIISTTASSLFQAKESGHTVTSLRTRRRERRG